MQLEQYAPALRVSCTWGAAPDLTQLDDCLYYVDDRDWWTAQDEQVQAWRGHLDVREVARIDRIIVYALERR